MASQEEVLEILITADNQTGKTFDGLKKQIGTVDSAFGGLGGAAVSVSKNIALAGAAAAGAATVFAGFAVNEAAKFQSSIQNINTLLKGTAEEDLPAITQGIKDLAGEAPSSLEDLTQAFYDIQSGTGAGAAGLETLTAAAKAATAGSTSTTAAAGALITVLNAYGLEASEAGRVSDIMFATVREGVITFEQLSTGVGKVAKTGSSANQTFETTGAAMAVLTANTNQQAESFTKLEQLYNKLSTTKVQEDFRALGIEVLNGEGKLKDLGDIIEQVSEKQLTYTQILKLLPDKEAASAVDILAGAHESFKAKLEATNNAAGDTDAAFKKMAETFDFQFKIMQNAFDLFLIAAGDPLLEKLGPLVEKIGKAMSSIEGQIVAGAIGDALASWVDGLADFLVKVYEIVGSLSGLEGAATGVSFAKWVGDIETIRNFLTVVVTVVGGLALAVAGVHDVFAGVGNIIAGMYKIIKTGFLAPLLLVSLVIEGIANVFAKVTGMDLSGPLEAMRVKNQEIWDDMVANATDPAPFEYWSDNVAQAIGVVDAAVQVMGNTTAEATDKTADGFGKAGLSLEDFKKKLIESKDITEEQAKTLGFQAELLEAAAESRKKYTTATVDGKKVQVELIASTKAGNKETEKGVKLSKDMKDALVDEIKSLKEFQLGLEEIQSQERVSIFEIKANLDIASMQNATERFNTMFSSIDGAIASTGDLMGTMFAAIADPDIHGSKLWDLQELLDAESKRRDAAFELQRKATEAEIGLLEARTALLAKGTGEIKVSAEGLEPDIEAFMFRIMDRVRIAADGQGQAFLLGD